MSYKIVIVNYSMGNLFSVQKKLKFQKIEAIISNNPNVIEKADKIILPGVGHFKMAIENLKKMNFINSLNEAVIVKKKPILGICLGMQLMANRSEEGDVEGLKWIDADVVRFGVHDTLKYKIPHTGWNQVRVMKDSIIMKNIPDLSEFYFVHSYHYKCNNAQEVLGQTEYEYLFDSMVEKENVFGVQFHPEKSHGVGELLLKNFINL